MDNLVLQISQLLRKVNDSSDPELQLRQIVDSISGFFNVDVCSVYLLNEKNEPTLYASHGLIADKPISLAEGKGLIGRVIQNKTVINVADAAAEEGFELLPSTGEMNFKSFCAVPLVRKGQCVGGLVLQSKKAEKLDPQLEALLSTLAAQLAWLIPDQISLQQKVPSNLSLSALKGAGGVVVGDVHVLSVPTLEQIKPGKSDDPQAEYAEWLQVKQTVKEQLIEEKTHLSGSTGQSAVTAIFDAYLLLLDDSALNTALQDELAQGADLAGAIKKVILNFAEMFEALADDYLASRADDLVHLGNKIIRVIFEVENKLPCIPNKPVILFANDISVSDIALFAEGQVLAIVCSEGSLLSHTAILANALGIPALLGLGKQHRLKEGERVIVDADHSKLIRYPSDSLCREYRRIQKMQRQETAKLKELKDLPAVTRDGARVQLLANSGLLNDIQPSLDNGAEGVGLYRTEIPFMSCSAFPTETEQVEIYQQLFMAFKGRPVYFRVLDIGGDKQLPYFQISDEENPALGWRGIRFCLDNTPLFISQLRSILLASEGYEGLHILAPMVSDLNQVKAFKGLIADAFKQLTAEGHQILPPKVGCMIEVPAAISQIRFWADELDFISIGSNDLCQYLLSIDRNNPRVASLFQATNPAVIFELNRIVEAATAAKLKLCLCGEMASDPYSVVLLVGMGVRTLSLGAAQLPRIKKLIRLLDAQACRAVLNDVLQLPTAEQVQARVSLYLQAQGFE